MRSVRGPFYGGDRIGANRSAFCIPPGRRLILTRWPAKYKNPHNMSTGRNPDPVGGPTFPTSNTDNNDNVAHQFLTSRDNQTYKVSYAKKSSLKTNGFRILDVFIERETQHAKWLSL